VRAACQARRVAHTAAARLTASAPSPSKRLTLIACILGSGIVFLDGTVVNVALPAIRADLHVGLADQQWVVAAYLLTLGSLILLGGSLGDLFGRRKVFGIGVVAFGVCSLLCAIAPSSTFLIPPRGIQGVAGALLVPNTLALIMDTFDEDERSAAIGTWTAWTAISTVVGPLGGGALIGAASWRWVFAINVVPVLFTLWLLRYAPEGKHEEDAHVDWLGAVLAALGLAGPVFALIEQPANGWGDPIVAIPLIAGLVMLVLFVLWERRTDHPMLPLDLFRSRNFAAGNAATLTIYAGLSGALFLLGLFLQETAGYSPFEAGLSLMPITILTFALSRRFGALADRIGPHLLMTLGPIVAGVGLLLLLRIDADADYVTQVLPGVTVFGLGLSATVAPLTATVLAAADLRHSGVASGVNNAVARVAGLLAIAVVGAVCASQFTKTVDEKLPASQLGPRTEKAVEEAKQRTLVSDASGVPPRDRGRVESVLESASVDAFRLGMGIAGIATVAGGLISLVGIERRRRPVHAENCPGGAICGAGEDVRLADATPVQLPARAG
jgi:EmrB/QacA subfamily drug resistance transporter